MSQNQNFNGLDGFIWFKGVVEDRKDPLFLGRCKIRCIGWHTSNKTELPTEDLPWAIPLLSIDHRTNPVGPREGDWVMGFFIDGIMHQEPVMIGIYPGIPEEEADPNLGFNDPTPDELLNCNAVPRPPEFCPTDTNEEIDDSGLSIAADQLPGDTTAFGVLVSEFDEATFKFDVNKDGVYDQTDADLLSFDANFDGEISSDEDKFLGSGIRPEFPQSRYPLAPFLKEPTTSRLARGEAGDGKIEETIVAEKKANVKSFGTASHESSGVESDTANEAEPFQEPRTPYDAVYPFNHVDEYESGHVIERDDTPGKERLHEYHRSGTFREIHPDGKLVYKVIGSSHHIVEKEYTLGAQENIHMTSNQNVRLKSGGVTNLTSGSDMNLTVDGGNLNVFVKSGDVNMKVTENANIKIKGNLKLHVEEEMQLVCDKSVKWTVAENFLLSVGQNMQVKVGGDTEIVSENLKLEAEEIARLSSGLCTAIGGPQTNLESEITAIEGKLSGDNIVAHMALSLGGLPPLPAIPCPSVDSLDIPNNPELKDEAGAGGGSRLPGFILGPTSFGEDVWKPASDSDGNAVALSFSQVPISIYEAIPTGELEDVTIQYLNTDLSITSWDVRRPVHKIGKLIETGRFTGIANGGRAHYRFTNPGGFYGGPIIMETGDNTWLLADSGQRHMDIGGGGSGDIGGGGSTGGSRAPTGPPIGAPIGFLWKPASDSDGNLVILLPNSFPSTEMVTVTEPSLGTITGRFTGRTNGDRPTYRFPKSGASFESDSVVKFTGFELTVPDGSLRYEN